MITVSDNREFGWAKLGLNEKPSPSTGNISHCSLAGLAGAAITRFPSLVLTVLLWRRPVKHQATVLAAKSLHLTFIFDLYRLLNHMEVIVLPTTYIS